MHRMHKQTKKKLYDVIICYTKFLKCDPSLHQILFSNPRGFVLEFEIVSIN
jgi:hypothetical protein